MAGSESPIMMACASRPYTSIPASVHSLSHSRVFAVFRPEVRGYPDEDAGALGRRISGQLAQRDMVRLMQLRDDGNRRVAADLFGQDVEVKPAGRGLQPHQLQVHMQHFAKQLQVFRQPAGDSSRLSAHRLRTSTDSICPSSTVVILPASFGLAMQTPAIIRAGPPFPYSSIALHHTGNSGIWVTGEGGFW